MYVCTVKDCKEMAVRAIKLIKYEFDLCNKHYDEARNIVDDFDEKLLKEARQVHHRIRNLEKAKEK